MPLFDLPLDELRVHRTEAIEPAGLDLPTAHALYPACGYATVVMDTRSQGAVTNPAGRPRPARRLGFVTAPPGEPLAVRNEPASP